MQINSKTRTPLSALTTNNTQTGHTATTAARRRRGVLMGGKLVNTPVIVLYLKQAEVHFPRDTPPMKYREDL
jgi:hypothetical protein